MGPLLIEEKIIGKGQPCFVIAEIGQNHQGDINIAKQLIDVAKECGANCVKFQKSCLEEKFTKNALNRPYKTPNSWGNTYGEHKAYLEFSETEYLELQSYAIASNLMFTASAMDPVSLKYLLSLNVPFIKIGSGDSNNVPLIEEAARACVPLVISTGMSDLEGVKRIHSIVGKYHSNFALLHCVSAYPTPLEEANLKAILTLQNEFPNTVVGYSGHEEGYNLTLAAVTLGASVIERHITLDKSWKGNDHKCSLIPNELKSMIKAIREIELALGDGHKTIMKCELSCKEKLGKTIVASKRLNAPHKLEKLDIKIKVAQEEGLPPYVFSNLIGKNLIRDLDEDDVVTLEHIEDL